MKRAPKIGERVNYRSVFGEGETWEETRTCSGVVTRIYQKHDDVFDGDGEFVRPGPLLAPSQWKAAVKVDLPMPKWWPYTGNDQFAPGVEELQPAR